MRTNKEVVEDASGEGEQECWFGEGGCYESRVKLCFLILVCFHPIVVYHVAMSRQD